MAKRMRRPTWAKAFERGFTAMGKKAAAAGTGVLTQWMRAAAPARAAPTGAGAWLPGLVIGASGTLRFRLFRPAGVRPGEPLPLMVMLHGCSQDASRFAASTRMDRLAARKHFMVLYPEQDRLANVQGCWNWFDTDSGRAYREADLILKAIDQVCALHRADPRRVAVAGLSAGASMAALLVTRHPERFQALVMHSGIPPGTAHSALSALRAMRGRRPTAPRAATSDAMAAHWPPLLVIQGTADGVVSPENGRAATQLWADASGAKALPPRTVQRGRRYPMSVTDFKLSGRIVATLVAVEGLAHAWSGGAPRQPYSDSQGPDASGMAWAFAARQFPR